MVLAVCLGSLVWAAPTPPARPSKKKPPQPKLPELKTPEDKLRFLEAIRATFPTIRSTAGNFTSADLDDMLKKYVVKETKTPSARSLTTRRFCGGPRST